MLKQPLCHAFTFGSRNGGAWKIHCFECRKICPNGLGIIKRNYTEAVPYSKSS